MKLDTNTVLFNAGGAFALLMVGAYFVRSAIFPDRAPPCSTTGYSNLAQMPLQHPDGEIFSAGDLQARLAGRDLGVLDYAKIVKVRGEQSPVLEVSLPKGSLSPRHTGPSKGGVAFQWRPSRIEAASAACLSYSVWLPPDFDFKRGGTLPGVYGAGDGGRDDKTVFAARYMWRDGGRVDLLLTQPSNGEVKTGSMDQDFFQLPLGKWVRLEQEVVLNGPGRKDGALRVWADGKLVVSRQNMVLRENDGVMFGGVQADAFYGGLDSSFAAPKDSRLRLTPFEVRTR